MRTNSSGENEEWVYTLYYSGDHTWKKAPTKPIEEESDLLKPL